MQVTLEATSKLERKMRISVPAEQVETRVDAKLKQAAGQANINVYSTLLSYAANCHLLTMVRKERLELSHLSILEPKSSASTNSATFAQCFEEQLGSPEHTKCTKINNLEVHIRPPKGGDYRDKFALKQLKRPWLRFTENSDGTRDSNFSVPRRHHQERDDLLRPQATFLRHSRQ